ncbi:MAG: type II toxin-antitoxin system VapC family toxin [Candidatus Atribacteria bacterium]|nr:type II toxin-antitoxin system VapC family toxin [Candidatus Atribacteria bacterium]
MKEIPIIDANIILRFLTNDIPKQADHCTKLLKRIESGLEEVWLPDLVLADIVWTLEKFYKQPKQRIQELLIAILELKGLRHNNKKISKLAFQLYVEKNIDWTDAFVAAQMITQKKFEIYSYDSDFDKVDGINRLEP